LPEAIQAMGEVEEEEREEEAEEEEEREWRSCARKEREVGERRCQRVVEKMSRPRREAGES
jgi:hypothetical protein